MLAIVSHDAGGAEVLSSYVRRNRPESVFTLEGPARKIFGAKLGRVDLLPLSESLRAADAVLCGSSWQSDLELRATDMAKQAGKRSTVFLDHWTNYAERFTRAGATRLPDELWVGDECAESIALSVFPGLPVSRVENPYFADIRDALKATTSRERHPDGLVVLYVCEPVRDHALAQYGDERYLGYTEEDALRYFLSHAGALGGRIANVMIRPHPAEARDKYDWARREFDLPISAAGSATLLDEVSRSDVVVGCESMAMVIGLIAGKRVVSTIPPGGRACSLPQPEIEHLRNLP
jgi:hypothetical protein